MISKSFRGCLVSRLNSGILCCREQCFHIHPGGIDPLGQDVRLVIQYLVEYGQCHVGHADFIDVGESQGDSDWGRLPVFNDAVPLAAGIAGWFRDLIKYIVEIVHLFQSTGVNYSCQRLQLSIISSYFSKKTVSSNNNGVKLPQATLNNTSTSAMIVLKSLCKV